MKSRSRLLVLSSFQRWFLFNFVFYTAVFLSVLGAGLFLWYRLVVREISNVAGLLSETFMELLQKQTILGLYMIVGLVLILLGLAAFQSFLFSRRIAGPVFALARHLEKCEQAGELKHLKLRKDDLFVDLAEKFNRLADSLDHKKK
ncbi:MAG: hypothetical protein J0L93_11050 [Deltaproteobacteria bacterium]|nr:hypothetical protein [Deltaproteobacteria bacterium]